MGVRRVRPFAEAGFLAGFRNCDRNLWACALWVEKRHGTTGPAYIAEQAGRLALAGDAAGFDTWKAIANRFDALVDSVNRVRQ
jgi:hypothetical protein